jgi:hypothetical protein
MDQYRHPHESRHSIDEVVQWFDRSAVDLLLVIPPVGGEQFTEETALFAPRARSGRLDHFVTELAMLLSGGRDGGLYVMIGRKRGA